MNDVIDLQSEITQENPRLGAALALAGTLVAAGASLMVVLILGIAHEFPDTLPAHVLIGFLTVLFVGLGGFGVRVAIRGVAVTAPGVWRAVLDQREALFARLLGDAGYGAAGVDRLPREKFPPVDVRHQASRRPRRSRPIRTRRHAPQNLAFNIPSQDVHKRADRVYTSATF